MSEIVNHLLIVNPSEIVLRLVKAGVETKSGEKFNLTVLVTQDYQSVMPSKEDFEVEYKARLIDLRFEEWDSNLSFTSAIAYNHSGQSFLEGRQHQILLNNIEPNPKRLESYYKAKPGVGDFTIETLSYNGRHIVVQCLKFTNESIEIDNELDREQWNEIIETTFTNLDSYKIINGPAQCYYNSKGELTGIRQHPCNVSYTDQLKGTSRHWWDIWPSVVMLQKGNSNIAFRKFYEWYTKTGKSSKKYWFGSEGRLSLPFKS